DVIESCLRAGADGCILDNDSLDDLRQGIEFVVSGQNYCSPQVARRLFSPIDGLGQTDQLNIRGPDGGLTRREAEILRMIAYRNLSNKEIARELRRSPYTIKNHLRSIFEKLDVGDRQTAARHAVRKGLLSESIA